MPDEDRCVAFIAPLSCILQFYSKEAYPYRYPNLYKKLVSGANLYSWLYKVSFRLMNKNSELFGYI